MKFGFPLFGVRRADYAAAARVVEERGFESIWTPEHLIFPATMPPSYPYAESGLPDVTPQTPLYDPWVVLGFIACATERIRLGTQIFILPLRHPIGVARSIVTLDRLSGGRVTLGAGVGWLEEEFNAVGQSFADRGDRMDEMVPLLRRLFSEEIIEHHGKHFDFPPVAFAPKPAQRAGVPIELGGSSARALRRAGKIGDGWIEIGCRDLDELSEKLSVVMRARREAKRDDEPFEVTTTALIARDGNEIYRAAAVGVSRVIIGPEFTGAPFAVEDVIAWADTFHAQVMRHFEQP